jgi:hypothetical protein
MSPPVVLLVRDADPFREQLRVRLRDLGYLTQISDLGSFLRRCPVVPDVALISVPRGRWREVAPQARELLSRHIVHRPKVVLYAEAPEELDGVPGARVVPAADSGRDVSALVAGVFASLPSVGRRYFQATAS